jgi:hypothetical protein
MLYRIIGSILILCFAVVSYMSIEKENDHEVIKQSQPIQQSDDSFKSFKIN